MDGLVGANFFDAREIADSTKVLIKKRFRLMFTTAVVLYIAACVYRVPL